MEHSQFIEQKIRERAYEIYEYRRDNGMKFNLVGDKLVEVTGQDDWIEAEREICGMLRIGK